MARDWDGDFYIERKPLLRDHIFAGLIPCLGLAFVVYEFGRWMRWWA